MKTRRSTQPKLTPAVIAKLRAIARRARRQVASTACASGSCHIASSLSPIDLLVSLYFRILNISPKHSNDPLRDRFIFSKGHGGLGLYSVLAEAGFFPHSYLKRYGKDGSKLAVHPVRGSVPGIEATTGSLGHGLPMGLGLALAARRDRQAWRSFVLMSDGECDEGANWEAIMLAGHLSLDNLVAIVDYNKLQGFGRTEEVLNLEPFGAKWRAARWATVEIDGHDFSAIEVALRRIPHAKGKPTVVIAHTIKGKGVPYMENTLAWHYLNVKPDDLEKTLAMIH